MNLPNDLPQPSDSTVTFDPKMLEGADWETLNSLAYKFQGEGQALDKPMQVAAGGLSFQTQRALNELDREGQQPVPKVDTGNAWGGKDSKMIEDWRSRNKNRQDQELKRLLEARKKAKG
jgi:hypothetical protein